MLDEVILIFGGADEAAVGEGMSKSKKYLNLRRYYLKFMKTKIQ